VGGVFFPRSRQVATVGESGGSAVPGAWSLSAAPALLGYLGIRKGRAPASTPPPSFPSPPRIPTPSQGRGMRLGGDGQHLRLHLDGLDPVWWDRWPGGELLDSVKNKAA